MKTLKTYLAEAAANTHMQHIEQLVFDLGVEGTRKAIFFLRDVRDMLSQSSGNKKTVTTVKWDGAPAVFAGINPENGKFFVAKKGLFNKNPKLYYSHADIDSDTSGDLADKLKVAFTECAKLGIKSGVFQGDIMFTKKDLKMEEIEGKNYITFHPNTILYAVPVGGPLSTKIKKSNIGIVWHTTYTGQTLQTLQASFGENITDKFRKTQTAWMEDATFKDVTGAATFTDVERQSFDAKLTEIGKLFQQMSAVTLNAINKDSDLLMLIHTYDNSKVRAGERVTDVEAHVDGLYDFIDKRYAKEAAEKKSVVGKERADERRKKILNFFMVHPKRQIIDIFKLSLMVADAKLMLISKLNQANSIGTFLKTKDGFRATTPEGFVAISDHGAIKLVDRMEFSLANFDPAFLKGWQR